MRINLNIIILLVGAIDQDCENSFIKTQTHINLLFNIISYLVY